VQSEAIDALGDELRASIAAIFDTAYAIEEGAGSSPAWSALCAELEVPMLDDDERAKVRAAQRPTRGAPVAEVMAAAEAAAKRVRRKLKKIDVWDAPRPVERAHEKLMRLCESVGGELVRTYKGEVLPETGMFANVLKHHDPTKKTHTKATAHALRCTSCGAPKLRNDPVCPFCDNPMVKT